MWMYAIVAAGGFSGIAAFLLALRKNREAVGWGLIGIVIVPLFILMFLPSLPNRLKTAQPKPQDKNSED